MAPLNDKQLEQIKIERKIQIMTAALRVFSDNGIKLTKISMIAKEAGISHGLLYHYFRSKDEVLHTSLEWAMSGTDELFQSLDNQFSPLEKIKQFTLIAFSVRNSDVFRIVQHITRTDYPVPESTKTLIHKTGQRYIEFLYPLIIAGQQAGEIIEEEPHELLDLFLTVISGLMTEDLTSWENQLEKKVDLLLRMITKR
ncbi:TetR/AcrR family transcriptional regulator [Sutcliffiella rhizosphaerae]|uniref:HTH-type transcriptional regulator BetI n=1 Tax=Sutcliffiella rhizosphaerae TaxID=2880967 RepID=A0ABM8YR11_9BACI|nr:TetR/AcrR family transcriptional regulator [Sutcliffiella rhizosphaerae]CAG9622430.1 HTH-type transcriptional regulator BetI [Sutcliffiella rhizosphaerae]